MAHTRRADLGLGKTARGGNSGSYAAHHRASAAPPPSLPSRGVQHEHDITIEREVNLLQNEDYVKRVPNFATIMGADPDVWLRTPWAERRKIVECAAREIIAATPEARDTPSGIPLTFGKWAPLGRAMGRNVKRRHRFEPHIAENTIQLNSVELRTKEPKTIADTILHEVAHGIDDWGGAHGESWERKQRMLLDRHGMTEQTVQRMHTENEREHAAGRMMKKIIGTCKSDPAHISYRDGFPRKHTYVCTQGECRTLPAGDRVITYARNPEYIG